ncbi:hypothetical protein [Novosphingobium sp. FKTRR1]|uniref:hypothetical protein n=1 Tax=Novosphingobium sp. FKTRR1 TaxID=2879118 RepID=UPI001CF0A3A2|nr:hypothetical protein [Novosphingobium sp. FKTRR1]
MAIFLSILAGASLMSAPAAKLPAGRPPRVQHYRKRFAVWQIDIAKDTFTGRTACQVHSRDGRMQVQGAAVSYRFPERWNVGDAMYKVDGGAVRASRDDLPRLIASGAPLDAGGMANPSAGLVWIPFDVVGQAAVVEIAPRAGAKPRTFRQAGLVQARDWAQAYGCGLEGHVRAP